ncbi:DUF1850 domain-containing protein [Ureibacillus acetophenoni]|nr:DUF1850 domain-containing protein [Ureibacillus acetophenoni]
MSKNKKGRWFWSISSILLLAIFFIRLSVFSFVIDERIYYLVDKSFQLKWIHSVEKEEWIEVYEKSGDELLLTETYFKTFGAGVPSDSKNTELVNGFVRMDINLKYPEMNLTVSENVQTTIITDNRLIPLYSYTSDYELVHIKSESIYLWQLILGGKL